MVMNQVMKGVIAVVGGVIGLVIIASVISDETGADGAFEDFELAETVLTYLPALLALGLLAGAVALWRFR